MIVSRRTRKDQFVGECLHKREGKECAEGFFVLTHTLSENETSFPLPLSS